MGILGLSRLIADTAPEAIREVELKSLFSRRIAIDASMSIYQFLIAIRNRDQLMTNESGDTTSHLIGLFYRTIKLLELGIKPIYVFDGKAPQLKCGELTKRAQRRKEAQNKLADAMEEQDVENISKFNKRVVRVTRQHNDECKKLLQLLGLPVIESPSEAEAQCAQLCKEGLVYATATEDMDGLTFGSPRLVRNLTTGTNEKVKEYYLDKVLSGLGITHKQFIDLGILMGCDYCDSIRGIGGVRGLELIKTYGSIEQILEKKFGITEFIDVEVDYSDRRVEQKVNEDNDEQNGSANGEEATQKTESEDNEEKCGSVSGEEVTQKIESEDNEEKCGSVNGEEVTLKIESEDKEEKCGSVNGEETQKMESEDIEEKCGSVNGEEVTQKMESEDIEEKCGSVNGEEVTQKLESEDNETVESKVEECEDSQAVNDSQMVSQKTNDKKKRSKDKKTKLVPENWFFIGARKLFTEPNVLKGTITESDLKQKDMNEEAIVEFLCAQNGFSEDRVRNALKRVKESKAKCSQTRIDSFFKIMPNTNTDKKTDDKKNKRNTPQSKSTATNKRGRKK